MKEVCFRLSESKWGGTACWRLLALAGRSLHALVGGGRGRLGDCGTVLAHISLGFV